MPLPLTKKEEDVLVYIYGYMTDHEYSPTREEISDHFNFTPQNASYYVNQLVNKGKIKISKGKIRNIVII